MAKVGRYLEGEATREKVLAAAGSLIAENGYSATSMSMISKASGVKPASIYWAFGNKEGLFAAILERAAGDFFALNGKVLADDHETVGDALRVWAKAIAEQPLFLRLLLILSIERQEGDPQIMDAAREIRRASRKGIELLVAPFVEAQNERQHKSICRDASRLAIMLFDGTFVSMQIEPDESSAKHLANLVALAVEGSIIQLTNEAKSRSAKGRAS